MQRKIFLASGAGLVLAGCGHGIQNGRLQDIAKGGEPLRAAFNRDADKVHVVLLVSPT